jgi:predicted ATP-dependent protease
MTSSVQVLKEKLHKDIVAVKQGDRIGRIFAYWVIVFQVAHVFGQVNNTKKVTY